MSWVKCPLALLQAKAATPNTPPLVHSTKTFALTRTLRNEASASSGNKTALREPQGEPRNRYCTEQQVAGGLGAEPTSHKIFPIPVALLVRLFQKSLKNQAEKLALDEP